MTKGTDIYTLLTIYVVSYIIVELDTLKRHNSFYFVRAWNRYKPHGLSFFFGLLRLIVLFPLFALLAILDI